MQLKVKRTQEQKGLLLKRTVYGIKLTVDYSEEERAAINAKNLGGSIVYEHEKLRATVKSLKDGQYFESDDLAFLTQVEEEIRTGLKNLKTHIQVANAFDGSDQVEEI